MIKILIKQ